MTYLLSRLSFEPEMRLDDELNSMLHKSVRGQVRYRCTSNMYICASVGWEYVSVCTWRDEAMDREIQAYSTRLHGVGDWTTRSLFWFVVKTEAAEKGSNPREGQGLRSEPSDFNQIEVTAHSLVLSFAGQCLKTLPRIETRFPDRDTLPFLTKNCYNSNSLLMNRNTFYLHSRQTRNILVTCPSECGTPSRTLQAQNVEPEPHHHLRTRVSKIVWLKYGRKWLQSINNWSCDERKTWDSTKAIDELEIGKGGVEVCGRNEEMSTNKTKGPQWSLGLHIVCNTTVLTSKCK